MTQYVDSVNDLSKIQASKSVLEQWVHLPCFDQLVRGMFVRIGVISNGTITSYNICEIVEVVEAPKVYSLGTTWTNKNIKLRPSINNTKICRLEHVSNCRFTHEEFKHWRKKWEEEIFQVPTINQIQSKLKEIVETIHFQLKELADQDQDLDQQEEQDHDHDSNPLPQLDNELHLCPLLNPLLENPSNNELIAFKPPISKNNDGFLLNNEVPPEKLVFSINLLLSMILETLSHTDWFKSIRLVNSHWASVATKFLQQLRFGPSIQFTYDSNANCFLHQMTLSTGEMTEETLDGLTQLINNCCVSVGFPCNEFRFSGGHLNDGPLQQFFSTHGHLVKKLTLNLSDDDDDDVDLDADFDADVDFDEEIPPTSFSTLASFRKLLTEQVPNLQYLGMDYFPRQWGKRQVGSGKLELFPNLDSKPFLLPKLRTLDFETAIPPEILLDLLKAAHRLEELFIPELNDPVVTYLVESNRLKLLQTFFTFNCKPSNLAAYEKFAEAKLQLMKIELDVSSFQFQRPFWPRMARCLSRILVASAMSLQRVFWCPVGHLPGLFIPTLNNVFTLSIQDSETRNNYNAEDEEENIILHNEDEMGVENDNDNVNGNVNLGLALALAGNVKLFPPGISMKSIFPNLVAIDLANRCTLGDSVLDNFDPLLSVKKLTISQTNCVSADLIGKFAIMFPNVAEGAFRGIHNFSKVAHSIWKFEKMEELDLGFTVGCNCKGNVYPAIDMGLTGLTRGTCKMLLVMGEDEIQEKLDANLFREKPSILDLKDLELLTMEFADDGDEMKDSDCSPLITELTGKYAFDLLVNLEISVKVVVEEFSNFCKIKKCLEQIRPYVSSGPW